jgi:hypothetical protein
VNMPSTWHTDRCLYLNAFSTLMDWYFPFDVILLLNDTKYQVVLNPKVYDKIFRALVSILVSSLHFSLVWLQLQANTFWYFFTYSFTIKCPKKAPHSLYKNPFPVICTSQSSFSSNCQVKISAVPFCSHASRPVYSLWVPQVKLLLTLRSVWRCKQCGNKEPAHTWLHVFVSVFWGSFTDVELLAQRVNEYAILLDTVQFFPTGPPPF